MQLSLLVSTFFFSTISFSISQVGAQLRVDSTENAASASRFFPSKFKYSSGYTTATDVFVTGVEQVELSNDALGIKTTKNSPKTIVRHEGKIAWEALYPEGSFPGSPIGKGGLGFYMNGSAVFHEALKTAKEAVFGYSVFFEEDFDFVIGGKLPGACELLRRALVEYNHMLTIL